MSIHDHIKALCKEPRYELGRATQAIGGIGLSARLYVRMPPRTGKTTLAKALMLQALDYGKSVVYVGANAELASDARRGLPASDAFTFVEVGAALTGLGFDLAIMDPQWCRQAPADVLRWYSATLCSRLTTCGGIIYIEPTGQPSDYNSVPLESFQRYEPRWQLIDLT